MKNINQTPRYSTQSRGGRTPTIPSHLLSASATPNPVFNDTIVQEERRARADGALREANEALKQIKAKSPPKSGSAEQPLKAQESGGPGNNNAARRYGSLGVSPRMKLNEETIREESENEHGSPKFPGLDTGSGGLSGNKLRRSMSAGVPSLKLPGPAIRSSIQQNGDAEGANGSSLTVSVVNQSGPNTFTKHPGLSPGQDVRGHPRRVLTSPNISVKAKPGLFKRYFSRSHQSPLPMVTELPLEAYRDFDTRRSEFFSYMDDQLALVSEFYKQKEDEAVDRFQELQHQLEIFKEHQTKRAETAASERHTKNDRMSLGLPVDEDNDSGKDDKTPAERFKNKVASKVPFLPLKSVERQGAKEISKTPLAEQFQKSTNSAVQDYTRRRHGQVSYTEAKSKIKYALQEFYRTLGMLKSYAMLNREAFRKIIKKYDKTISSRHAGKYMSEKVDRTWFVESNIVDTLMSSTENLYAYFEKGSHKVAANKLRIKHSTDYSSSSFRNGLLLGAGGALGLRGLVHAADHSYNYPDPVLALHTSYLLQIYAGFFLALVLVLGFCLGCRFWTQHRINYVFIFEFDPRSSLDWRQMAEIPCLLWFLLGLIMFLNFAPFVGGLESELFLYYPVILVGLSICIVLCPFKHLAIYYPWIKHGKLRICKYQVALLYPHSRAWFAFSNFRLYTGGIYPVEFRDFFLGDLYCSLTYVMGNIELFFCLYSKNWTNTGSCNSSSSILFGLLTCLPGVWRALQCLRRYKDTQSVFPHLANFGKYLCTILFYMTLSLYRLDSSHTRKVMFILFATVNSIYVSIWDISFDWSLSTHGKRGLVVSDGKEQKFGFPIWYYYPAVVLNPMLR